MLIKRLGAWVALVSVVGLSGCCWWCDKWCGDHHSSCTPVCCNPAPQCYQQQPCCQPAAVPVAPAQNWNQQGRYYNPQTNCCP